MKDCIFTINSNELIAKSVYRMTLTGDTSDVTNCGQFVNIKLDGFYLRRPISVCDVQADVLTLIYKVVGNGTEKMSQMCEGEKLSVRTEEAATSAFHIEALRADGTCAFKAILNVE